MDKIMIVGSGGAGKSTLAREIGKKLKLPVYHLDVFLWKPNWEMTSREEQIAIQSDLLKNKTWVIDGNYSGTMEIRLEQADTVIFLNLARQICLYRAIKRMLKYRDGTRPDMREGNKERIDLSFYKWIWDFPKKNRPDLLDRLDQLATEKKIVILDSTREVKEFLAGL